MAGRKRQGGLSPEAMDPLLSSPCSVYGRESGKVQGLEADTSPDQVPCLFCLLFSPLSSLMY
jgi:hypothetical protein